MFQAILTILLRIGLIEVVGFLIITVTLLGGCERCGLIHLATRSRFVALIIERYVFDITCCCKIIGVLEMQGVGELKHAIDVAACKFDVGSAHVGTKAARKFKALLNGVTECLSENRGLLLCLFGMQKTQVNDDENK